MTVTDSLTAASATIGELHVTGPCSFDSLDIPAGITLGDISVTGSSTVSGDIAIAGSMTVTSNLTCTDMSVAGILDVAGQMTATSGMTIGGELTVSHGDVIISGAVSCTTLAATTVTASGNIVCVNMSSSGLTTTDTLLVNGASTFGGNVLIESGCQITGDFSVAGNAKFNGGLHATALSMRDITLTGACVCDSVTANTITCSDTISIGSIVAETGIQLICGGTLVATLTTNGLIMAPGKGVFVEYGGNTHNLLEELQNSICHVLP
jgi:hypothetical protein